MARVRVTIEVDGKFGQEVIAVALSEALPFSAEDEPGRAWARADALIKDARDRAFNQSVAWEREREREKEAVAS